MVSLSTVMKTGALMGLVEIEHCILQLPLNWSTYLQAHGIIACKDCTSRGAIFRKVDPIKLQSIEVSATEGEIWLHIFIHASNLLAIFRGTLTTFLVHMHACAKERAHAHKQTHVRVRSIKYCSKRCDVSQLKCIFYDYSVIFWHWHKTKSIDRLIVLFVRFCPSATLWRGIRSG